MTTKFRRAMTIDRRTREAIVDRWLAGDSIDELVDDYGTERMAECVLREALRAALLRAVRSDRGRR